jgi:hypothetical protein
VRVGVIETNGMAHLVNEDAPNIGDRRATTAVV